MGATVTNLLMGPCDVFLGAFGATEPTLGTWTAPGVAWTDAGGTLGGVKLGIAPKYTALEVDQIPMDVGQRKIGEAITIETMLAEATLENVKALMNGGTIATGTGYKSYEPLSAISAFQPTSRHFTFIPCTSPAWTRSLRSIIRLAMRWRSTGHS